MRGVSGPVSREAKRVLPLLVRRVCIALIRHSIPRNNIVVLYPFFASPLSFVAERRLRAHYSCMMTFLLLSSSDGSTIQPCWETNDTVSEHLVWRAQSSLIVLMSHIDGIS